MLFVSHGRTKGLVKAEEEKLIEKVNIMCDNIGMVLKLWDGAFSAVHATNPDKDYCKHTHDRIDKSMVHTQRMGISITP
jgi:hypothetical protein